MVVVITTIFCIKYMGHFSILIERRSILSTTKTQGMSVYMVDNVSEFVIVGRCQGTHSFSKTKKTKLVLEFKVNKIF